MMTEKRYDYLERVKDVSGSVTIPAAMFSCLWGLFLVSDRFIEYGKAEDTQEAMKEMIRINKSDTDEIRMWVSELRNQLHS